MTYHRACLATFATMIVLASPLSSVHAASACPFVWSKTLRTGSVGEEVRRLQLLLNADPVTMIARSGDGSPGHETDRFGRLTREALVRFQEAHAKEILVPAGLTHGTGVVGTATRAALNATCESPSVSAVAPVSNQTLPPVQPVPLSLSPAMQPAQTLAPAGALYVPFTSFTLTAGDTDVEVTKLTATRVGPGVDQAFDYVSLLDEQGDEVTYGYLLADHTVTFRDAFTVPAHETHTYTIAGNMKGDLTEYDGQRAGFDVTAITASVPVVGPLPIRGTYQSFNQSLPIGSATVMRAPQDPASESTRTFGDTLVTFSGIRVSAGSLEDLRLRGMIWRMSGSAGANDLTDVQICAGDTCAPAEIDGREYSAIFSSDILLPKGGSMDLAIRGRLASGAANRTVEFDVREATDIMLRGTTYGYGIAVSSENNTDVAGSHSAFLTTDGTTDGDPLTPFYAGSIVNVTSGSAVYIGL